MGHHTEIPTPLTDPPSHPSPSHPLPLPTPSEWTEAVLNTYDVNGEALDPALRGRLSQYNLIVGGVRLTQTRIGSGDCSVPAIQALYGPCHDPDGPTSTDPFGNLTAASEYGVDSAFLPTALDKDVSFELFLNPIDDVDANLAYVEGLQVAGWLDVGTDEVRVQLATLNGEVGCFGRVELRTSFRRGGRLTTDFQVTSIPVHPYRQYPLLMALDVLFVVYLIYMIFGTLRRVAKTCRTAETWGETASELLRFFRLLDYAVTLTLIAVCALFGDLLRQLSEIRSFISPDATPADYAKASDLQLRILAAADDFWAFKEAMVWLVIFMSFRLFKYFTFQPRLAVMIEAFSRGLVDLFHGFIVFGTILAMFGVWGHFLFGTQAKDWSTVSHSMNAVIRFSQYDYDLEAMQQTFPAMAEFFFSAMMLGVTNLTIWMFFGVVLETYSEVRAERLKGPTLWEEAAAFISTFRRMGSDNAVYAFLARYVFCCFCRRQTGGACCCCRTGSGGSGPSARLAGTEDGGRPSVTWPEVIAALSTGPLRDAEYVGILDLQRALGLSERAARLVLADALFGAEMGVAAADGVDADSDSHEGALRRAARGITRGKSAIGDALLKFQEAELEGAQGGGGSGDGGAAGTAGGGDAPAAAVLRDLEASVASLTRQLAALQTALAASAGSGGGVPPQTPAGKPLTI